MASSAVAGIEVHATCAGELARDATNVRTLRSEVTRALDGLPAASKYTLDVALVRLEANARGSEYEVIAEVRAMLSDDRGRVIWTSSARSSARGETRERSLIQRDAVVASARQLGRLVRDRCAGTDSPCR